MNREARIEELKADLGSKYIAVRNRKANEKERIDAELRNNTTELDILEKKILKTTTIVRIVPILIAVVFYIVCIVDWALGNIGGFIIVVGLATSIIFFFVSKFVLAAVTGPVKIMREKKVDKLRSEIQKLKSERHSLDYIDNSRELKALEDEFAIKMAQIDGEYIQETGHAPAKTYNSLKQLVAQ